MGRGRSTLAAAVCALTIAAAAGCGASSSSSTNSEAKARPARVQVTLSSIGARAHPETIEVGRDGSPLHGSGDHLEVLFVIHNNLDHRSFLEVHGGIEISDDHNSKAIAPHGRGTLRVPLYRGIHQLNGNNIPNQTNGQLFIVPLKRRGKP
ncbi:MAG TPA: hypothetical protein VF731_03445 [Solirubrobacterales bacterium]